MKIRSHDESHIVEMDDGSRWRIFPGDLDLTLGWKPETELKLETIADDVSSRALVNQADNGRVRVISASDHWPIQDVKDALKKS